MTTRATHPPPSGASEVMSAIERITELFRFERFVYLTLSILAFAGLAACVVLMIVRTNGPPTPEVIGMFSSSGVIVFTISRVLRMWTRALDMIERAFERGN